MASVQTIWGIDVGRCALKAIKLRLGADGTVEILGHDYVEHAKILSQPDVDRHELIAAALEKFLSHHDISKDKVVVGVPGQHTLARFTKLPPVAPKRIPDIVRYEADQQIPFDMDEVIWDYQTFQEDGLPDIEVGIFAMKRELLREHLLDFEQANIEPIAVQSGPLALYNAARFEGLLGDGTTVLLDIGAENTDLVIATPGNLWCRTIPIGGNSCTEALVKSFKLSFSKAEALKRSAETSKYRRQIFQAMRPVFADLVQELQRSIGFYSSTHRDAEIGKLVGTGNGSKLPGLRKYLQQNLGVTVEIPGSFHKAAKPDAGSAESLDEQHLSFYVAYGLAVQGLDLATVTNNLLPTEIAKQIVWRRKRPAFAAIAACLLLSGAVIWFRQTSDSRALAAGSASARARAASIRDECKGMMSELNRLSGDGVAEHEQIESLITLRRNKTLIPRVLEVIHRSLPREGGVLGAASTQAAVLEAIHAAPQRGRRRQVTIDALNMQYHPDLNNLIWEDSLVPAPPRINQDADAVLAGIEINITCRTPNRDGPQFIRTAFMDPLRDNGRKPGTGFYFDRVWLIQGGRFQPKKDGLRNPANLDVITNEPMLEDWEFEIWLDVILEDFPEDE